VLRSLATSPAGACKNCHEFAFPDSALRRSPLLMQSTVSEHAASSAAAQTCADCHMPVTLTRPGERPHRDHRFRASRDPEFLRRALTVSAQRGPGVVRFTLRSQGVGHAFPTGDLFRRLEVGVEVVADDYRVLQRSTALLTRHFKPDGAGSFVHRALLRDTRIGPTALPGAGGDHGPVGERQVELPVTAPGPDARGIAWWVSYQRVAFPRAGDQAAEIEADIILASGLLPLGEQVSDTP